ncbi:hypothetical protein E4U34_004971 [Claviceps purpurea]|nr:hypothetical protein E4U51_008028 [Claviceps purpurea]KAG6216844.1 hypothetical protein E4U34_004971 [Claviceps purpurea]
MDSHATPIQTAQTSASAEFTRGLIDYLIDQLQKCNNLPAVQDGAQWAQLKARMDVIDNTLTNDQDTVRVIRGDVSGIEQYMTRFQGDMRGLREDFGVFVEEMG